MAIRSWTKESRRGRVEAEVVAAGRAESHSGGNILAGEKPAWRWRGLD